MGFLDNVRDALREAVSPRAARQQKAAPVAPSPPAAAPEPEQHFDSYTVELGDTLDEIGARCGSSATELARINAIDPDLIFPGQVLRVPAA